MGLFSAHYDRPGPGIPKDAPQKKGFKLFFEVFLREFFELIKLNLLYVLFCIPIVTIPAATTAMSRVTLTMIRDKNHFLWSDFLNSFKTEFLRSTAAGFLLFLGTAAALFGVRFYGVSAAQSPLLYLPLGVSACVALLLTFMGFYLFPLLALVNLPFGQTLKNALLLAFICLPVNLAALAAAGVIAVLFVGFLPYSLPVMLLFCFAQINFITSFFAYRGLQKYVIREE